MRANSGTHTKFKQGERRNLVCVPELAGFGLLEYLVMLVVIIVALTTFRYYIQHGYQGQMVKAGETFAFGREYDPKTTIVCTYDDRVYHVWYSEACVRNGGTIPNCKAPCPGN